ncbi:MAG: hypothetical protein A3H45_05230 [Ignavibacteria bacterium RIFCSPLOWO2_02_FULL_55_14]|nr:MAG: hypothetical protein A2X68_12910 [Ignavibacteria bacterium GWC2_56_12]OGU74282.1 MAG: hypothetical protein A3H45_05230 [Ignavibacteria bacterium RIFCSPLOWO2_02_FULL_55_14]
MTFYVLLFTSVIMCASKLKNRMRLLDLTVLATSRRKRKTTNGNQRENRKKNLPFHFVLFFSVFFFVM